MYLSYFGLAEAPFSIAPDPRYLYMSQRHQEALAHLLYGVNSEGGFVLLTGEVGAGKTTIFRCLLEQIPESCQVAYVFNPKLTVEELLTTICVEFGIAYPPGNTSVKVFIDYINSFLLRAHAKGKHMVLIIDEAQNLAVDVLEQMRLLTNLETNRRKLLQITLIGQPELAAILDRPELRQLSQRIVARYHLGPLGRQEISSYVRHRLEVSGTQRQLFPSALMAHLYALTGGVPRVINVLCDRALLGAFVRRKESVDRATLDQAAREVFGEKRNRWRPALRMAVLATALVVAVGVPASWWYWQQGGIAPWFTAHNSPSPASMANTALPPAAPAPAVELPRKLEWPTGSEQANSDALANAALFRAWGVDYLGGDICPPANDAELHCLTARGSLLELRKIDLPAVLTIEDDQGQKFHAAMTSLGDRSATFTIGDERKIVDIGALAAQWSGDYTLLWRLPPGIHDSARRGERSATVTWLRENLAQVERVPAGGSAVFDESLQAQIRQFQSSIGLSPDGAAESQTIMRLAALTDKTMPRLSGTIKSK